MSQTPEDINAEERLRNAAPKLFDESLVGLNTAPKEYFDRLHERVVQNPDFDPRRHDAKVVRFTPWIPHRAMVIAAGMALLFAVSVWLLQRGGTTPETTDPIATAAEIFRTQDENEMTLYALRMDEDLIVENIDPEVLYVPDFGRDLTDADIIDYLMGSGVSAELIYSVQIELNPQKP